MDGRPRAFYPVHQKNVVAAARERNSRRENWYRDHSSGTHGACRTPRTIGRRRFFFFRGFNNITSPTGQRPGGDHRRRISGARRADEESTNQVLRGRDPPGLTAPKSHRRGDGRCCTAKHRWESSSPALDFRHFWSEMTDAVEARGKGLRRAPTQGGGRQEADGTEAGPSPWPGIRRVFLSPKIALSTVLAGGRWGVRCGNDDNTMGDAGHGRSGEADGTWTWPTTASVNRKRRPRTAFPFG